MKTLPVFSRRDFIKASATVTAATLIPGGMISCAPEQRIHVRHEWDTLEVAIVGTPYMKFPDTLSPAMRGLLPPKWISLIESNPGCTLEKASPALFDGISRQMDHASGILEARGVKVLKPGAMTTSDENRFKFPPCGAQLYPRDPLVVIGERVIETETAHTFRRRERFALRRCLDSYLPAGENPPVTMPAATQGMDAERGICPLIEGGDVLVLGRDILVGISGNASNTSGARWLARTLGSGYRVHEVRLSRNFLHLDCCLSTPRPGLAVICRQAFLEGIPGCLRRWNLIDVSPVEAGRLFACNGLVLDRKTIMVPCGIPAVAGRLRDAGQEVIETPFDAVGFFGGSLRCWHQPLVRA